MIFHTHSHETGRNALDQVMTEHGEYFFQLAGLMSKTELAQLAGISAATIARIESGESCRMETKRKIIFALSFTLADKDKVFPD
jgi:DNA-binding XRE family transcriptional regulator